MSKLAVIFTNFSPYHLARIKSLYNYASHLGWNIYPIELARQEKEYEWRAGIEGLPFRVISLEKEKALEQVRFVSLLANLYVTLSSISPDVVAISGYGKPVMLGALTWARWKRIPTILFSASNENDAPRMAWLELIKRLIVKNYDAALVGGRPQKRYLEKLGIRSEAIFLGYNTVGNDTFHPTKIRDLPSPLSRPYFLAINRFMPRKNLSFVISCYSDYLQSKGEAAWDLVLCGDGELLDQVRRQVTELNLQNRVHLPGFLQQHELLPYFAHAGCFIHASLREQWGLVVNEAMAAGLSVLVSNRCGCFEDLVVEGVNGFGFDPENHQQLTNLMLKVSSGAVDLERMGQAALDHIQRFSPDYFAEGLMQAVNYSLLH